MENLSNIDLSDNFNLNHINFNLTDLSETDFSGSNLIYSIFKNVNLFNTNFSYSILDYTDFSGCQLSTCIFNDAQLINSNLYDIFPQSIHSFLN